MENIFINIKCFFFDFIYCVKIPVRSDQKWRNGGQRGSTGGLNLTFFNVYFHYLFIYSSNTSLFSILLVCEECCVFVGGNVL